MKRIPMLIAALLLLLNWGAFAQAASTATFTYPAEGATVKAPVRISYESSHPLRQTTRLEVARGKNATSGFMVAELNVVFQPGTQYFDHYEWDAEGFNPGEYTLRLSVINHDTGELHAQGIRNVVLEGADYSPKVALQSPGTVSGVAVINGSVTDSDLESWMLVALGQDGKTHHVASGDRLASFPVTFDIGDLPDGEYTLRLSARDRLGQEAKAEQRMQVKNVGPVIHSGMAAVDPVLFQVPISYTASSAVKISVVVFNAEGQEVAKGAAEGANREATVGVPVSFRGVAPGEYRATAKVEDRLGRTGSSSFAVLVREPLPKAKLEAPASAEGDYFVHVELPEKLPIARLEMLKTTKAGTDVISFPTVPSGPFSTKERAREEGIVSYRVVLYTPDGRISESDECVVITDYQAPILRGVSVAPVDGQGINMRWQPATDNVGISYYEVHLVIGTDQWVFPQLTPDTLSFSAALSDGEYGVVLTAVDVAGRRTNSDLLKFRVQAGAVALLRDGVFLPTDVPGFIEEGRTWVPLRFFGEALGYTVTWDGAKQAATIRDPKTQRQVVATVGQKYLPTSGPEGPMMLELPAPPRLVDSRVLVPLRALVEAFGVKVEWHGEINTVELLVAN